MSIIPFSSEEFGELRTIEQDGQVLFCGRDAADAIADHKQTSHRLNACLWGLRDAFKACKETWS